VLAYGTPSGHAHLHNDGIGLKKNLGIGAHQSGNVTLSLDKINNKTMKNDCLVVKSHQYANYITNLLVSLVRLKFTRNLLFYEFVFFTYSRHVSKTCMTHFSKLKIMVENISFYLYVHHTCFEHMMSISGKKRKEKKRKKKKKKKPMK
jgi:hypothetical protein